MEITTITFLILSLSAMVFCKTSPDYYWRGYSGQVPEDAFKAGVDNSGQPIYIGQATFFSNDSGTLPGTLYSGSTALTASASNKVFKTNNNVNILCAGRQHKPLSWVRVNSYNDIAPLSNVHIVEGGIEVDSPLYLARQEHEGNLRIGKVLSLRSHDIYATFPNSQGNETSYAAFELLVWNF